MVGIMRECLLEIHYEPLRRKITKGLLVLLYVYWIGAVIIGLRVGCHVAGYVILQSLLKSPLTVSQW